MWTLLFPFSVTVPPLQFSMNGLELLPTSIGWKLPGMFAEAAPISRVSGSTT